MYIPTMVTEFKFFKSNPGEGWGPRVSKDSRIDWLQRWAEGMVVQLLASTSLAEVKGLRTGLVRNNIFK